jgi:hypothetical protein
MRPYLFFAICAGLFIGLTLSAQSASPDKATVGQMAPDFTLTGGDGKTHSLSDFKGKFIVLEWTNPNCPFVHKFYDSGTMQKLQAQEAARGVIWLRINSGAPGHDGYQTVADIVPYEQANHVASTETLLDPDGKVGHLYGALHTPQMFVIDPKGTLIYAGGIDDKPSADQADIPTAKNFVAAALDDALAGKPVSVPISSPYGCSVKYANN